MKNPKIVLFCNQLDNRGTGRALHDYFVGLRKRGYDVEIATLAGSVESHPSVFLDKWNYAKINVIHPGKDIRKQVDCDVFYMIKSGRNDGIYHETAKNCVHGVFEAIQQIDGLDRNAYVSRWLAEQFKSTRFVPHMIYGTDQSLRPNVLHHEFKLTVGRTGGYDTFDIPFVKEAVIELAKTGNFRFKFVNTKPFCSLDQFIESDIHHQEFILTNSWGNATMNRFIDSCDVMLHARERGETFGISVGEFAVRGKPVLTYALSPERAHIEELSKADRQFFYSSKEELVEMLFKLAEDKKNRNLDPEYFRAYTQYDSESVMDQFEEMFIL